MTHIFSFLQITQYKLICECETTDHGYGVPASPRLDLQRPSRT